MLNYPAEWKFDGIGIGIPSEAVHELMQLTETIADGSQEAIEIFKGAFGGNGTSSSYSWAITDLRSLFEQRAVNAPRFIDSFWQGVERAEAAGHRVPTPATLNRILRTHGVPLELAPPALRRLPPDGSITDREAASVAADSPTGVELREQLGSGGYGVVHRAVKRTSLGDFEYAVKVLDPSPFVEDYEKALSRFKREVDALRTIQHRAIISYIEAGVTSRNQPYVLMPLISGKNLLDATEGLDLGSIGRIFLELLDGLAYAHSKGIVHRDLKPTNVIVRASDLQPIILDFGAAYVLDEMDSKTLTTRPVGTIGYIPQEVLDDPKLRTPLHDVYSCGIMLYECCARRRPDVTDYVPLAKRAPDFAAFDESIGAAIAGHSQRTRSMDDFAEQLRSLSGSSARSRDRLTNPKPESVVAKVIADPVSSRVAGHLVRNLDVLEKKRLLVDLIPKAHQKTANDEYADHAACEALVRLYRLVFSQVDGDTKREALHLLVSVLKGKGASDVAELAIPFFESGDLCYMEEADATFVVDYLLCLLDSVAIPFGAVSGLAEFASPAQTDRLIDSLVRIFLFDPRRSSAAENALRNNYSSAPQNLKPAIEARLNHWLLRPPGSAHAEGLERLRRLRSTIDVPF